MTQPQSNNNMHKIKPVSDKELGLASYTNQERPEYEVVASEQVVKNNEQLHIFLQKFNLNIGELMTDYSNYKLNPGVSSYYNKFVHSQLTIDEISKSTNSFSYHIQNDNAKLNQNMAHTKSLIQKEEVKRKRLMKKYAYVEPVEHSSSIMINSSVENYKSQYMSNWIMFIGVIIISISIVKVFKE